MSLSPGYKCGDSFNFHLQKSIARWESRLRSVQMWHDVKYEALDFLLWREAATQKCPVKKVTSEISQNAQEKTCARVCNFIKKEALA